MVACKECDIRLRVLCCPLRTDRPGYLILFRTYVSRNAAGKGRAVLEGVGLDSSAIEACFQSNPLNNEEAVQAGLIKWRDGGHRVFPCTWAVLIGAMEYAGVGQQHIAGLKEKICRKLGMYAVKHERIDIVHHLIPGNLCN